jgi:hypothetical protein
LGGQIWLDPDYILKVEAKGIAEGLDVGCEREHSSIISKFVASATEKMKRPQEE